MSFEEEELIKFLKMNIDNKSIGWIGRPGNGATKHCRRSLSTIHKRRIMDKMDMLIRLTCQEILVILHSK